jgi:hypothetical protein
MRFTKEQKEFRARLVDRLQSTNSLEILEKVRQILDWGESDGDFWDDLSDIEKAKVMKGKQELKDGHAIPAKQVLDDLNQ